MLARVFGCCRVVFNDALRARDKAHRAGENLSDSRNSTPGDHGSQDHRQAWLAVRGAQCGFGAVGQRLPAGMAQLLRLPIGQAARSQSWAPPVQIPQGSSTVLSAHSQRIQLAYQRPIVCGQGRRGAGALVAGTAQPTVVGHDHSRTRWALLRHRSSSTSSPRRCQRPTGKPVWTWGSPGWRQSPTPMGSAQTSRIRNTYSASCASCARLEREKSRRQKGSANRNKTRRKVAVAHNQVARARRDYHHKQALALVRDNQVIHVEDLNIAGMVANRRLARAISDAGWGQFVRIIGEKADRYGRTLHTVSRWLPSSKTCSATGCGYLLDELPLQLRTWICPACRAVHDRDHNAAKVILAAGRAERLNACGAPLSPPATREAQGNEAGSAPNSGLAARESSPSRARSTSRHTEQTNIWVEHPITGGASALT